MYYCIKKTVLRLFSVFVCVLMCSVGVEHIAECKIKCDCIFSIGPACRPAQWLRKTKKRFQSSPLDWMMKYSLSTALHFFSNKFSDFFEDVEATGECIGNHRVVRDKKNSIVSMHHFNKNISLNTAKNEVRSMMLRRGKAVDNILKKSNSIVLLCNREKDYNEELKRFARGFSKLYPGKNIAVINIRSNNSNQVTQRVIYDGKATTRKNMKKKSGKQTKQKAKRLRVIEYNFRDVSPDTRIYPAWEGSPSGWKTVINDIELSDKFFNRNMDFQKVEF